MGPFFPQYYCIGARGVLFFKRIFRQEHQDRYFVKEDFGKGKTILSNSRIQTLRGCGWDLQGSFWGKMGII